MLIKVRDTNDDRRRPASYLLPKEEFYLAATCTYAAAAPAANHIKDMQLDHIKISFDLYVTSQQKGKFRRFRERAYTMSRIICVKNAHIFPNLPDDAATRGARQICFSFPENVLGAAIGDVRKIFELFDPILLLVTVTQPHNPQDTTSDMFICILGTPFPLECGWMDGCHIWEPSYRENGLAAKPERFITLTWAVCHPPSPPAPPTNQPQSASQSVSSSSLQGSLLISPLRRE